MADVSSNSSSPAPWGKQSKTLGGSSGAGGVSSANLSNDMYRVGDYVYFEVHAGQPYQIRKIEELSRTSNGAQVEVKVQCFYRRRDMPASLITMADKHYAYLEEENEIQSTEHMDDETKHQLRHRELFLSRQSETVPAQYIRGKCSVHLLSEVEGMAGYLHNEDQFFYTLVFDPTHKSLQADRGEMRVGTRFQAEVAPFHKVDLDESYRSEALAELVWDPKSGLTDASVDAVLFAVKSVGTLARAVEFNNHSSRDTAMSQMYGGGSCKDPGLLTAACSASRDSCVHFAYKQINKHNYDLSCTMLSLVPDSGMVLVRDEMEAWSVYEANLFEEALEKIGKDFALIKDQMLPWKTMPSIIEYYYMWKTTDRYMRQKRLKAADVDQRLKQVYIPSDGSVNNPNKTPTPSLQANRIICEGCETDEAPSWFLWGPNNACRLCDACWVYWKKYGGLIKPNFYEGNIISSTTSAETARYECRNCGKLFNRQERLINHMATHGEYCCTVGQCEKDFKSRNQLHRHLATVHKLVLTKKDTYVQAIKSRTCFLLVTTPLSKFCRHFCPVSVGSLARKPCFEVDSDSCQTTALKSFTQNTYKKLTSKKSEHYLRKLKVTSELVDKIRGCNEKKHVSGSWSSTNQMKRKLPSISLPICSAKVKRINWVDQSDGVLYVQTDKTQKLRNLLSVPQQKKCGRRPSVLALPDMGRG